MDELQPAPGEVIVTQGLPRSFTSTTLQAELPQTGRRSLIIVGFMTQMCVSSTTRDAAKAGYACAIVANACATRDLPDGRGGTVPAARGHEANRAALRDRFAAVVSRAKEIP